MPLTVVRSTLLLGTAAFAAGCSPQDFRDVSRAVASDPIHHDTFATDTGRWVVEQQPGGTVRIGDGRMVIDDAGGCTVWFREQLKAPVRIVCEMKVSSESRVSDMNFFWMATDPEDPEDLFARGAARAGRFANYDTLHTYYVGYGGNSNSTTRFRRYDGTGARPLLPEHDLGGLEFLLEADHTYRVELIATRDRVQFVCDGTVIFDFTDPEPLMSGWFGFRTVHSRIEVDSFAVFDEPPVP